MAAIMTVLIFIDQHWHIGIGGMTEEWVTVILAIIGTVLVWLTPNKQPHAQLVHRG